MIKIKRYVCENVCGRRNITSGNDEMGRWRCEDVLSVEGVVERCGYLDPGEFDAVKNAEDGFKFEVLYRSKKSRARVGRITTRHGVVDTPGFVPVATNGTLKHVPLSFDVQDVLGMQLVFCNTYHLMVYPGIETILKAGGIHNYSGYKGPIITDSGGYQIFSMSNTDSLNELKAKGVSKKYKKSSLVISSNEDGIKFRSYLDGHSILLTPQISIQSQKMLGSDIIIPLDFLLPNDVSPQNHLKYFHRTHRWEGLSLKEHLKNPNNQAIYSVIHGGLNRKLRRLSIDYLTRLPFQGIAIGGSLGQNKSQMFQLLEDITPQLPLNSPIHLLGIGDEESIRKCILHGIDTFDSSYPTKSGRHGNLLSPHSNTNILKSSHLPLHHSKPIPHCQCPTCKNVSASQLHHLYRMKEPVAGALGTVHNLYYMTKLMESIREDIMNDKI